MNLLITVYRFAIVTDHAIPTASVNMNKEVINSADVNRDLGMNQADSKLLCPNSSYEYDQPFCTCNEPQQDYCVTYNENTYVCSKLSILSTKASIVTEICMPSDG